MVFVVALIFDLLFGDLLFGLVRRVGRVVTLIRRVVRITVLILHQPFEQRLPTRPSPRVTNSQGNGLAVCFVLGLRVLACGLLTCHCRTFRHVAAKLSTFSFPLRSGLRTLGCLTSFVLSLVPASLGG